MDSQIPDKFLSPIPEPSPLTISTSTILISINGEILMELLSRYMDIYPYNHSNLESENGGVYSIEYIRDLPRHPTPMIKKPGHDSYNDDNTDNNENYIGYSFFKSKEFDNQTTFKFQYWGFRNINIFGFMNGTLKLTGTKSESEATKIAEQIIKYIQATRIYLYTSIEEFKELNQNRIDYNHPVNNIEYFVYALPINPSENTSSITPVLYTTNSGRISTKSGSNLIYFRYGYSKYLLPKVNCEKVLAAIGTETTEAKLKTDMYHLGYYSDEFAVENINQYIELIKSFDVQSEQIYKAMEQYGNTDFSHFFDKILTPVVLQVNTTHTKLNLRVNINKIKVKDKISTEEKAQIIYNKLYEIVNNQIVQYKRNIKKELDKFINVRQCDVDMLEKIGKLYNNKATRAKIYTISDFFEGENKPQYSIGDISTEMINSDYSLKFNLDLQILPTILKKYLLHSEYNPENFQGVSTRFYYNPANKIQGICSCARHCATVDKKSPCDKITIIFFRPGSILINGAKNTTQIREIYDIINKIIKDNYEIIRLVDTDDELRKIQMGNNDERKICKKHRIFYFKKSGILNYPFYLE
jgi:TATA-box binding protein (TBP) (component of TFIID and TFIIIB)